jgi:hypothetical protein
VEAKDRIFTMTADEAKAAQRDRYRIYDTETWPGHVIDQVKKPKGFEKK